MDPWALQPVQTVAPELPLLAPPPNGFPGDPGFIRDDAEALGEAKQPLLPIRGAQLKCFALFQNAAWPG